VVHGLALLAGLKPAAVERILSTRSPRAVTALVWQAGLSMRFARQIQLRLARISPKLVLNPRDGDKGGERAERSDRGERTERSAEAKA